MFSAGHQGPLMQPEAAPTNPKRHHLKFCTEPNGQKYTCAPGTAEQLTPEGIIEEKSRQSLSSNGLLYRTTYGRMACRGYLNQTALSTPRDKFSADIRSAFDRQFLTWEAAISWNSAVGGTRGAGGCLALIDFLTRGRDCFRGMLQSSLQRERFHSILCSHSSIILQAAAPVHTAPDSFHPLQLLIHVAVAVHRSLGDEVDAGLWLALLQ